MNRYDIERIIRNALAEDIGGGDVTTSAIITDNLKGIGKFLAKQNGIAAGLEIAEILFKICDSNLIFTKKIIDGEKF